MTGLAEKTVIAPEGTRTQEPLDVVGALAVLTATACWGTSGVFIRFIVDGSGITALALAFWRDVFTFAVLLAGMILWRPAQLRVRRRDLPWLAALGGSLGIFHVFWNLGVLLNGAAVATVQQAVMPAIVAVVAWIIWREALTWSKMLAIVLAFVGTVLVSGPNVLLQANLDAARLLVGMGIPIMGVCWTLFGKRVRARYGAFVVLTYAFGFGMLTLLPLQVFTPQPNAVPPEAWLWFAALIAVTTIGGFAAYAFALGRLPASVASILSMSEIPIASAYAYVILGERVTADQLLGAVLVVVGVLLLSWRRRG